MQQNMEERMRTRQDGKTVYSDGDVTIRKSQSEAPPKASDDGEYVDYEEV